MKTDFLNLIPSALTIIYATYGSWFLIKEIFCSFLPFTVIFTAALVCLMVCLRVPPPDSAAVEAVLGKELHLENTDGGYVMKTVAHRGAGYDAPENSLEAFKLCHEKGCNVIEFDVTLTKDGVPIIFHDKTLERMADADVTVNDSTWEELANINISVNHPLRDRVDLIDFTNSRIPTLDLTVQQLLANGQRMFIDIKDNDIKIVPVILDLFKKYPELLSRAVVTSFFPNIIYWIRRSNPKIVGCLAWRPYCFTHESFRYPEGKGDRKNKVLYKHYLLMFCNMLHNWALPRITYYLLGLSVILLQKDSVSGENILYWRKRGVRVIAWSVNSLIEKQHISRNLKITYLTDTLTGEETVHNVHAS
ncbi:unnamed protein product [Phaedon cochleariae]|uniref:GP-PDE domain-containing protein n=1 Tax=Phaedon cochleariae TaxID=80249 RepID=A0A9P0DRZ0_PHACE|nr:unnamed protein product [Phaedon cochleariae]